MKYLIASDLHGSLTATEAVLLAAAREQADALILLGDLFYHGPRNPLPAGYAPLAVAQKLSVYAAANSLLLLRGNCDAAIDGDIAPLPLLDTIALCCAGKKVFLSHGHIYAPENPPKGFDVIVNGHFHTAKIEKKDGLVFANPGSPALPKGGTQPSYLLLEEMNGAARLVLKTLAGDVEEQAAW